MNEKDIKEKLKEEIDKKEAGGKGEVSGVKPSDSPEVKPQGGPEVKPPGDKPEAPALTQEAAVGEPALPDQGEKKKRGRPKGKTKKKKTKQEIEHESEIKAKEFVNLIDTVLDRVEGRFVKENATFRLSGFEKDFLKRGALKEYELRPNSVIFKTTGGFVFYAFLIDIFIQRFFLVLDKLNSNKDKKIEKQNNSNNRA